MSNTDKNSCDFLSVRYKNSKEGRNDKQTATCENAKNTN